MRGSARRREAQRGGAAAAGADARPDRARATPVGAGHMQAAIGTPCANTRLQERRRQAEARVPAPQEGALADAGEAGVAPSAIPRAATPYPGRTTRSGAGTAQAAVTPGSHAPILPVAPPMPAVARTHDLPRQLDAAGGTQKRKPCDLRSVQGKIKRLTREISQSPYVAEPSFFDVAARGAFVVSTVGNGGFGECFKAVRMFGATSYSEACRFIQAMGGAAVDDGAGDAWHPLLERLVTHGEGALYVELAIKRIYEDSTAADVYNEVRHLRQLEGKPCIIPLWAEEGVWGGQEELVSKRRRLEAGQALERIKDQRDRGKRPDPADEACAEWVDAPCCSLVFPHFAHDSFRHLVRHAKLSDVQHYMLALLTALRGMHSLSVIHRDIKPSNFLYNMKLREGYLIDFGLAQTEAEALVRKLRKDKRKQPSQQHHGQAGGASKGKELVAGEGRLDPVSPVTRAQASRGKRQVEQAGVGKAVSGKLQLPQAPNASKPLHHNKRATRHLPEHNKDARRAAAQPKPQIRGTAYAQGGSGVAPRTVSGGRAGTRGFRAPEVLMRVKKQTTAVDMWAAGIMLMCLLSGRDYLLFGCSDDLDSLFEMLPLVGEDRLTRAAKSLQRTLTFKHPNPHHAKTLKNPFLDKAKSKAANGTVSKDSVWLKLTDRMAYPERLRAIGQALFCTEPKWEEELAIAEAEQRERKKPPGHQVSGQALPGAKTSAPGTWRLLPAWEGAAKGTDDALLREAYDLLSKLLEPAPGERIAAEEALKHPFFDGIIAPTKNKLHEKVKVARQQAMMGAEFLRAECA